jgi:hypothetical protein
MSWFYDGQLYLEQDCASTDHWEGKTYYGGTLVSGRNDIKRRMFLNL